MSIWGSLFGGSNREPSAEREQREAEALVMQGQEALAAESEAKGKKRFAAVLRTKRGGEKSARLERDWEIVKIDDQTGEVVMKKEGVGEKTLSHQEFWNLNFSRSKEMLDELMAKRREIAGRTMVGNKEVARRNAADLAGIDVILNRFKEGDLGPMREFFAEPLARLQREAKEAEKKRETEKKELASDIEAQDKYLEKIAGQLAREKDRGRRILLQNEIGKIEDWKKLLSNKLSKFNSDPLPVDPELERLKGIVDTLDREIEAREKAAA